MNHHNLPRPHAMSELDSLSDSDWLDIASARDSDDIDDISDPESDRDEISSVPRSRRSSISNDDSLSSDVEAWEGFVSDSGDEALDTVTGMYPVPPITAQEAQPFSLAIDHNLPGTVDPVTADEDKRVREALDQSFVGTLSASRSSTTGSGHAPSTHTSIRDLRLSFPDPLTSSRDELNRSYDTVPSLVKTTADSTIDEVESNILSPKPLNYESHQLPQIEDPGPFFSTPEVQHEEMKELKLDETNGLDVVLYGRSSDIKWSFVYQLIQNAVPKGFVITHSGPIQTLTLINPSSDEFFNHIKVIDHTSDATPQAEDDPPRYSNNPSLAIVYLPVAKLPLLSWHDAYLPVVVPSFTDLNSAAVLQAAEDDWDLVSDFTNRTVKLGAGKSAVFDANDLQSLHPSHTHQVLRNIGRDLDQETKKSFALKQITEHIKSVNAVKLFALMSIVMGFVFNTAFRPTTPTPTPTVNTPSMSNGNLWGIFAPQPNGSLSALPSSNSKLCTRGSSIEAAKDTAMSVINPGSTSLSVTSKSLAVASISKGLTTESSVSLIPNCHHWTTSKSDKAKASMDVRPASTLSVVSQMVPSGSASASRPDSGSTILLSGAERDLPMSTIASAASAAANLKKLNSVSEVIDATTKLAESVSNDVVELVEAADELINHIRVHTDNFIHQSKGKARALGEQIQNFNEVVVNRNKIAQQRAKDIRKMGQEFILGAKDGLKDRTRKARRKARELRKTMVESRDEVWKSYGKAQEEWEGRLSGKQKGKTEDKENNKEKERPCRKIKRRGRGMRRGLHVEDCL